MLKNLSPSQLSCKTDLEDALKREFGEKTALHLSFNDTCDGTANIEITYQSIKHVNSRIETSSRTYSLMEIICGDFSNAQAAEIRAQCRSPEEAKICNINVGLHEFGHAIGLSHEDLRPEEVFRSTTPSSREGCRTWQLALSKPVNPVAISNIGILNFKMTSICRNVY
jgi:hypothetical protein